MEVTVIARHGKLPDSLRNQAMQRFARLERVDERITTGTLVIGETTTGFIAEVRLIVAGAQPMIGHAEAATLRSAMNTAFQRAASQLRKRRDRLATRRTRVPVTPRGEVIT